MSSSKVWEWHGKINIDQEKILCFIFTKGCESLSDIACIVFLSDIFLLHVLFLSIFCGFMLSHLILTLSFYSYLWNLWSRTLSHTWHLLNMWEEVTLWERACLNEWMVSDFKSDLKKLIFFPTDFISICKYFWFILTFAAY